MIEIDRCINTHRKRKQDRHRERERERERERVDGGRMTAEIGGGKNVKPKIKMNQKNGIAIFLHNKIP